MSACYVQGEKTVYGMCASWVDAILYYEQLYVFIPMQERGNEDNDGGGGGGLRMFVEYDPTFNRASKRRGG